MQTITRTSTTEMEVTSIRLERQLKDKLKDMAGNQGYQSLIRDIREWQPRFSKSDIRASISAIAEQQQRCVLTGKLIEPQQSMLLGLTRNGDMLPLSLESLSG